jgi:hypothetical protein
VGRRTLYLGGVIGLAAFTVVAFTTRSWTFGTALATAAVVGAVVGLVACCTIASGTWAVRHHAEVRREASRAYWRQLAEHANVKVLDGDRPTPKEMRDPERFWFETKAWRSGDTVDAGNTL